MTKKIEVTCPHCGVPMLVDIEAAKPKKPKNLIIPYIETWNAFAKEHDLPQTRETNKPVIQSLNARLEEKGFAEDFADALKTIKARSFWRGMNDRHWRVTLEYLCRPGNAEKLAEEYRLEERHGSKGTTGTAGSSSRLLSRTRGPEDIPAEPPI